jgi:hypothetical protein
VISFCLLDAQLATGAFKLEELVISFCLFLSCPETEFLFCLILVCVGKIVNSFSFSDWNCIDFFLCLGCNYSQVFVKNHLWKNSSSSQRREKNDVLMFFFPLVFGQCSFILVMKKNLEFLF